MLWKEVVAGTTSINLECYCYEQPTGVFGLKWRSHDDSSNLHSFSVAFDIIKARRIFREGTTPDVADCHTGRRDYRRSTLRSATFTPDIS